MKNLEIAGIFRSIAGILEIKGESVFRIRAYERAALNIEGLSQDVADFSRQDRLREIPGIGKDLSDKIKEYLETGTIRMFEELKKSVPEGLLELLAIPSVGPKTARLLYERLAVKGIDDLKEAIEKRTLEGIPGIKKKTVENILKGIEVYSRGRERMTLAEATLIAREFTGALMKLPEAKTVTAAGSLRRQKETVRDIDILVISNRPKKIMDAFTAGPSVQDVLAQGETKSSVRTDNDVQVDCRVVKKQSFGAALLYFTGSKDFNIKLRQLAIKKGLKINEYGVFRNEKLVCGETEVEIFRKLGLSYIEPELREDTGEIELAKKGKLPDLVRLQDIRGDLHAHSTWSDGGNSVEEMANAARKLGYSYIAITDHSQSLKIAHGLTSGDLKRKKKEVDALNRKWKDFKVLFATEVDIDSEGRIDYPDFVLKEFDVVVAAIHTGFKQSSEQLTRRLCSACENRFVHIIAHPTGRLWGTRQGYEFDFDRVFRRAKETNTALEINSFPERLDLDSLHCRRAKDMGVKLAINTDAHATEHLQAISFGVAVARRGWLTRGDVNNTSSAPALLKAIRK